MRELCPKCKTEYIGHYLITDGIKYHCIKCKYRWEIKISLKSKLIEDKNEN